MRNQEYGYYESNSLKTSFLDADAYRNAPSVPWNTAGLKITRLRMLTDPGFPVYDISYCWGVVDGKPVNVELPFHQLVKRSWKKEVIEYAKRDRVYAKGIGMFDSHVVSVLS